MQIRTIESRVWERAIHRGLLSDRQAKDCLQDAGQDAPTLGLTDVLVAHGMIRPDEVSLLRREIVQAEPQAPEEVRRASREPDALVGRYVLVEELGRGGMGVVYRAWDGDLRRFVALKLLTGPFEDEDLARFRREAQSAAALRHPNIITVYEIGDSDETPYIALELIQGRTLHGRKLPARKMAETMVVIARAVDAAHRRGIIHRDLKPGNLMVDDRGTPRVMDFGLAKPVQSSSHITLSGEVVGTPAYMSPEQAQGRAREVDGRSDLFSLGATMYELLTGRAPFRGKTPLETLTAVVKEPPIPVRKLAPQVPRPLEAILLTCLQKDKSRRYDSAEALARDLERFLRGEKVAARMPASPSRRAFALSAALAFAAAVAVLFRSPAAAPALPVLAPPTPAVDRSALDEGLRLQEEARLDLFRQNADPAQTRLRLARAEKLFQEALRRDPASGAAFLARGQVREQLQRPDDALADFAKAVEKLPTSPTARLARGRLLLDRYLADMLDASMHESGFPEELRRQRDRATEDFQKARALGASEGDLPYLDAVLAFTEETFDRALEKIAQALPKANRPEEFFKLRGDVFIEVASRTREPRSRRARILDAVSNYSEAIRLRANYLGALRMRGSANWSAGNKESVHADFQTILRFHPNDSVALSDMGTFYQRTGRIAEAERHFDQAIAADPRNYRAWSNRASIRLLQDRPAEAKADAEKSLAIRPGYLAALHNLATAYYKAGEKQESLRRFDEVLARTPGLTVAHCSRGLIHHELGHWKEALLDLERAVALDPSLDARFRDRIADCRKHLAR